MSRCGVNSDRTLHIVSESISETARSLGLLRQIEFTIDFLAWLNKKAVADTAFFISEATKFNESDSKACLDESGELASILGRNETAVYTVYNQLLALLHNATNARELDGEDKFAVVTAFKEAIASVADLHNAIVNLRWVIGEHDADLEKPSKTYSDVDEMFSAMGF